MEQGEVKHPRERNRAMLSYYIVCRSLTLAQRTAVVLERAGIRAAIYRSPKSISGEGCSHSVKIAQTHLPIALQTLHQNGMDPKRIYMLNEDGKYEEVSL